VASFQAPPLRLPEHQIDDPAPADVRPLTAAVAEHVGVVAPGVLEGVGEDRQPVEGTVGVDAECK
jgi:hypothetical protein